MGRMKGTTRHDTEYVERRCKPDPFHGLPTKAECAAIKAPPKKGVLAKAKIPMSKMQERIMLVNHLGEYLSLDCTGFTRKKEFAYFGTHDQVVALSRKHPEHAYLSRVSYATVFGIGATKFQDPDR